MSSQTNSSSPFPQWSPMSSYPYAPDEVLAAMQNQALNNSIYTGTSKVIAAVDGASRFINSEISGVAKDVAANGISVRDAVEGASRFLNAQVTGVSKDVAATGLGIRDAIDTNARYMNTEITGVSKDIAATGLGLRDAIERGNAGGMATTERVGANLSTAVERNGNATQVTSERIGGNVMTAIEKVAGEGRLTTTIVDAASRQASNDSARDILRAVDKNGTEAVGVTKDTYAGLLASIERNAGETRLAGSVAAGSTDFKLADVRHSILSDVNRVGNELSGQTTQSLNVLTKHITDSAWEGRTTIASGFQQIGEENLRTKYDITKQASDYYSNLTQQSAQQNAIQALENQKIAARTSDHYSSLLLEQQKLKEYLSSKGDTHFAMNQLEMQKVKEGLASQAAHNFASTQLEAQKIKECISAQLADAKYEALKSQQYLGDRIDECCCSVKEKMDVIDRDRLRDNLTVERGDNNILKLLELGQFYGRGRGDDRGRGRR